MLGHVVSRVALEAGHEVVTCEERYVGTPRDAVVERVRASGAEVVINCLGLTKQRSDDPAALLLINAVFPAHLMTRLHPAQYLVHASTDCVFDGSRGAYRIEDEPTATDSYGFSKMLGESIARWPNATVIRTSVIGPDRGDGRGLMAWFLRQPAERAVPGYINHRWNGITTLEWARLALALGARRARGESTPALTQPATPVVTKYELLMALAAVMAPDRRINTVAAPEAVDRSLVPSDERPPIRLQLQQLAAWYPVRPTRGPSA